MGGVVDRSWGCGGGVRRSRSTSTRVEDHLSELVTVKVGEGHSKERMTVERVI